MGRLMARSRALSKSKAREMAHLHFPSFLRQRDHVKVMDSWHGGGSEIQHLNLPTEHQISKEYRALAQSSVTPWLSLLVSSVAQISFLEGIRRPGSMDNMDVWGVWQENGWDARQTPLYRSALKHGVAFTRVMPGRNRLTGDKTALWKSFSAKRMAAFWTDDDPEWPMFAILAEPYKDAKGETGWTVRLYDEVAEYYLRCKGDGLDLKDWSYDTHEDHELQVCPIVQYYNLMDLDGNAMGEIEPFIPLARRINQDTFDRLVVQRFGAWKIRYIAGLVKPAEVTDEEYNKRLMALKVSDFLTGTDANMKFGTLEETQLAGFIAAKDADLRDLSATGQVPPYQMLGLSSNLQAESLEAVRKGLELKAGERRTGWGEAHEKKFRLTAIIRGNPDEATAYDMQSRWRSTDNLTLPAAADALSKIATGLKVPVEMLWEKIPGWTDTDSKRALQLIQSGVTDALIKKLFPEEAEKVGAV